MNIRRLLAIGLILGGTLGCKSSAPAERGAVPKGGVEEKVQAPVAIEAAVRASSATVTIGFPKAAESVRVLVNGASGLEIEGGPIAQGFEMVVAGSEQELEVIFEPGRSEGLLNVVVEGDFGGRLLGSAQAFEVGQSKTPAHSHRQIDGKKLKDHRVGP
jgi:hypothetical protein